MISGRSARVKNGALNVFVGGMRVGRLDRSDREEDEILFTYVSECAPQLAVSLTMPVRVAQYDAMSGLLPIFEMNLPEGALRERLRNQFAKAIPEFDDLDLLSIVGSSQIGRLRYSLREGLVEDIPTQSIEEILTYSGTADLFANLLERFATYSGISGVQPKVLVRELDAPDKLVHRGATHIIKAFDPAVYEELAANEFICMRGAVAAGIATASVRLAENRRFLVVDRFDLSSDGVYLGSEDFCVLDGRRAHGRYDGSYENLARRIADFVSPEFLPQAREQYARMVVYACGIENGDAHLKNFGVVYDNPEGRVRLAPAYDLIATTPYIRADTLALTLNGSKQFPDRERLIRFVRLVTGGSRRSAIALLGEVVEGVNTAVREANGYARDHPGARGFMERLVAALSRGRQRLLVE
jgi:serine/threonine-protein kinase HipA